MKILPVKTVDEVLQHALTKPLSPIKWSEKDELEVSKSGKRDQESKVTAH